MSMMTYGVEDLAKIVRAQSEDLPDPAEGDAFAAHFEQFADAKIVLLGEATHGSAEFYTARAAITQRLIERHGFRILALEADWPDAAELDRYVRAHGRWGERDAFINFPRWMWRNQEFASFMGRLRSWNESRDPADRAEVRGLDVYSLHRSVDEVLSYLDRVDPMAAIEARRRYGCLTPYLDRPQSYGLAAFRTGRDCVDQVVQQLVALLEERLSYAAADGESFFDAEQNARVVCAAEGYYRAMYESATASWNQRDAHMFDTLTRLIERRRGAKAIVWAHNSHIGNAGATSMGEAGEFNIGQLACAKFGRDVASIGFSTARGTVLAADQWGDEPRIMTINAPLAGSWERIFLDAGAPRALTAWRNDDALAARLGDKRLERAIGVIYRPQSERVSHYFNAHLSHQFDALVWFEETKAVSALPGRPSEGAPDIYPFGV
jgi:erythromycin esterase-like protein